MTYYVPDFQTLSLILTTTLRVYEVHFTDEKRKFRVAKKLPQSHKVDKLENRDWLYKNNKI